MEYGREMLDAELCAEDVVIYKLVAEFALCVYLFQQCLIVRHLGITGLQGCGWDGEELGPMRARVEGRELGFDLRQAQADEPAKPAMAAKRAAFVPPTKPGGNYPGAGGPGKTGKGGPKSNMPKGRIFRHQGR